MPKWHNGKVTSRGTYVPKMRSAGKVTVPWNRACTVNTELLFNKKHKSVKIQIKRTALNPDKVCESPMHANKKCSPSCQHAMAKNRC